jgi:hypothetical protein
MAGVSEWLSPGSDVSEWPSTFQEAQLDWIPDPMVLRAAELFCAGQRRCVHDMKLDASQTWCAIKKNIDGILAFFHSLMTRDRIPFIDYDMTYQSLFLKPNLGSIGLDVHPAPGVYRSIKEEALTKLKSFDAAKLPRGTAAALNNELMAVGYGWEPSIVGLNLKEKEKQLASFILGGLIFGGYAQASRTDHLLQNSRAKMFVALAAPTRIPEARGIKKEKELFAALSRLSDQDVCFSVEQENAPPTVLHHLLARGVDNSERLLAEARKLRDTEAGRRYRAWHAKVRKAWALGRRDKDAEAELDAVTEELKHRISGKPIVLAKIKVEGELKGEAKTGVNVGLAKVAVGSKGKVRVESGKVSVKVPSQLRNWFVDKLVLSRHQKLLLEMSLDRRSFDDLAHGLKTVWTQT